MWSMWKRYCYLACGYQCRVGGVGGWVGGGGVGGWVGGGGGGGVGG